MYEMGYLVYRCLRTRKRPVDMWFFHFFVISPEHDFKLLKNLSLNK